MSFFGEDDGCKIDDRGCSCDNGVGVIEVISGVGISVGGGNVGSRGDGVVSSGGDFGVAGGGASWRDCCRFPEIFRELWEDLPYSLSFTFNTDSVFL